MTGDAMAEYCCTCMKAGAAGDKFISLNVAPPEDITYKNKLKSCVPEMTLESAQDCYLCKPCLAALETAYTFRCMCLRTESRMEEFRLSRQQATASTDDSSINYSCQQVIQAIVGLGTQNELTNLTAPEPLNPLEDYPQQPEVSTTQPEGIERNEKENSSGFSSEPEEEVPTDIKPIIKTEKVFADTLEEVVDTNIDNFSDENYINQHFGVENVEVQSFISHNYDSPVVPVPPQLIETEQVVEQDTTPYAETKPVYLNLSDAQILHNCCKTIPELENFTPANLDCKVRLDTIEVVEVPTIVSLFESGGYANSPLKSNKCFRCNYCSKFFPKKGRFHAHILKHMNIQAYRCEKCRRGFFSDEGLRMHLKLHCNRHKYIPSSKVINTITTPGNVRLTIKRARKDPPRKVYINRKKIKLEKVDESEEPATKNNEIVVATRKQNIIPNQTEVLTMLKDKVFNCDLCSFTTFYMSKLKLHMRHHNDERPFPCTLCSKSYCEKWQLNRHLKMSHIARNVTVLETKRKKIIRRAKPTPAAAVETASSKGAVVTPIIKSIQSLAPQKEKIEMSFCCKICNVSFRSRNLLMSHSQTHEAKQAEPLIPPVEIKTEPIDPDEAAKTSSSQEPSQELPPKRKRKKFFCNVCNMEFASRDHGNVHTGVKPYQCNVCEKGFAAYTTLKKHKLCHVEGGAPGAANPKQGQSVAKEAGPKYFECEICLKKFLKKEQVYSHTCVNAKGDNVYRCQICKTRPPFVGRAALIEHMGLHVNQSSD